MQTEHFSKIQALLKQIRFQLTLHMTNYPAERAGRRDLGWFLQQGVGMQYLFFGKCILHADFFFWVL